MAVVWLAGCATQPGAPASSLPRGEPITLQNPSFEGDANGRLAGWDAVEHNAGKSYSFIADGLSPLSPPSSARINRHGNEIYGMLEQRVRVKPEWVGRTVRLSGYLKTAGAVRGGGALILQARSGGDNIMANDHMVESRPRGDQPWRQYAVQLKVPPGTWALLVGVMLEEEGTVWADNLELQLMP